MSATFRAVDTIAQENSLPKLRETILPGDDLEVRVLAGFGLFGVDGFVLKRAAGEWSAWHLRRMICHYGNYGKVKLPSPKSGWEKAWQRLVEAGILRLSGAHGAGIHDGTSYIVETNLNKTYLVYKFENPDFLKDKDSQRMVKTAEVLAEEFGLENFKVGYICR